MGYTKKKLRMFLYKISFQLQMFPRDYVDRLNWAQHCCRVIRKDYQYLSRTILSDACPFHSNEIVNNHNSRVRDTVSLQAVEQVPMTSKKVLFWCALHKTKILGPCFFRRSSADSAA